VSARLRRVVVAAASLCVVAAGAGLALRERWSGEVTVPLHTVAEEPFRRRVVAEGVLQPAEATPIAVPGEVFGSVRIAWMVPEGAVVQAGDPVVRLDPTDFERELVTALEDRRAAGLKLGKAEAEAAAARRNLQRDADLAGEELAHASTFAKKDATVFSRLEIVESEVDQQVASERQTHANDERGIREQLAGTEQALIGVERRKADIALDRAETGLRLLEMRAPHAGFITRHRDWRGNKVREGDTVWRGQKLGEIPNLARLQAEVWVLEADAGGLKADQVANITVEAHPGTPLAGRVARVQGVAQPRIPGSPVQYFGVALALDAMAGESFKVGQRVRAEIVLEEHEKAVVLPRQAVFEVEGKSVVYRLAGSSFETVPVVLGAMSAGRVVVTSGLAAGDRVALADPHAEATPEATPGASRGPELPGAR
jgi:HlyD family secretion protein